MSSLKEKYKKEVFEALKSRFGYRYILNLPKIEKIVVNCGIGKISRDKERVEEAIQALSMITGQRPVKTKSHKAISGFKIKQGLEIGLKATLRGKRMWQFLERLIQATLPRSRDFRGLELSSIDQVGNLNIGVREHIIFPEISAEKVKNIFGLQITVVVKAKKRDEAIVFYKALGFPLK